MSLNDLIRVLKGGPGSGDWGHAGRPGKRGGSAGGGGLAAIGVKPSASVEERRRASNRLKDSRLNPANTIKLDLKEHEGKGITKFGKHYGKLAEAKFAEFSANDKDFQRKTFAMINAFDSFEDPETGFKTEIKGVRLFSDGRLDVTMRFRNKDGYFVGNAVRTFDPVTKNVDHSFFEMYEKGKGFGSRFYYASEEAYKDAGYKTVTMTANLDVGGYAWGRMGYNFSGASSKKDVLEVADYVYEQRYGRKSSSGEIPQNAYSLAAFAGPDGYRVGKEAMLGSTWRASKNLDDNDPGYQAGKEYYKAKGIE